MIEQSASEKVAARIAAYRRVFDTSDGRVVLDDLERVASAKIPMILPDQLASWEKAKAEGKLYSPPPIDVPGFMLRAGAAQIYWYIVSLVYPGMAETARQKEKSNGPTDTDGRPAGR